MKKGFTLVELLGVIVIIGIIATIAAIAVDNRIKKGKAQTCEAQKENIIEAAKTWMIDNAEKATLEGTETEKILKVYLYKDNNDATKRSLESYIESDLKNPMTDEKYDDNTYVQITVTKKPNLDSDSDNNHSDNQKYDYKLMDGDTVITCN